MNTIVKSIFHPVGQGLFYSCKFGNFNFVYDCGSENKKCLQSAIDLYKKQELMGGKLDLLIISHLHDDHIIGLEELSQKTEIDTAILPYLEPIERLIVSLTKINLPAWYYEFLSDPIVYLIEKKKVKRVIIIGGKEGEEGEYPKPRKAPPEGPNKDTKSVDSDVLPSDDGWDMLPNDEELMGQIISNEPESKRYEKYIKNRKLLIKKHNGYVRILNLWIFRFFNYKPEEKKLKAFEDCLRKNNFNLNDSYKIIKNKENRKKAKTCYKILNKDLNNTSLILFHGPVEDFNDPVWDPLDSSGFKVSFKCFIEFCQNDSCVQIRPCYHIPSGNQLTFGFGWRRPGQFLTGDIDLRFGWDEIERHFTHYFEHISIVQIPHHCSGKNWNDNITNKIKNDWIWLTSAGISNKYGHPNINVIQKLLKMEKSFNWSNEGNRITIEGEF